MGNFKKVLALVVVFVMSLSMVVTTSAASVFPDVDNSDDYAAAISMLKSLQVLGGDDKGNFNPEKTITRAEFTKILFVLMNGSPDANLFEGPSAFTDVSENAWYNGYINWASNLNIVGGKGNNKFAPQDPVTTQEATKMFVVALTGKSTLAWPYGFVAEANKANINLYKDATVKDAAKPALRNLIAQLCANAIFATDVASFYEYNTDGTIKARPAAATAVFGLSSLNTMILDTSYDTWAAGGISLIDEVTVNNAAGTAIKLNYSSEDVGNYAGYSATVYFKDSGVAGLDAKDTILNIRTGDCAASTAKPLNIIGVDVGAKAESQTYQIGGIQFNPNTDLNASGKIYINDAGVSSTTAPTSIALTAANLVTYMGGFTKDKTTYGPLQDWDVKVVKDNTTGKINAVYVSKLITMAKVTTLNEDAGVIALDNTVFGVKNMASAGTAPNKSLVVINGEIAVGDYVSVAAARDFTGTTYTVSPLLKNAGAKMTAIKDNGDVVFGEIIYSKNTLVAADTDLVAANLGKKFNVYLDATGRNYLFADLADTTATVSNYVQVKSVDTTNSITGTKYTMTVVNASGETKSYTLASGIATAYLNAGGVYGWAATEDGTAANTIGTLVYNEINVLNKVVKITLNSDNEISVVADLATGSTANLKYDPSFKTFSINGVISGMVDDNTAAFYYDAATKTLTSYTGKNLPSFDNATASFTIDATTAKLKAIYFSNMGTGISSNTSYGVVTSFNIVAGDTAGKVKYVVTGSVNGSLTAELTTAEESVGGPLYTALIAAKASAKYVKFTFAADKETITKVEDASVTAGAALVNLNEGWKVGTVTMAANGIYMMKGVSILGSKITTIGSEVYYTVDANADIYTRAAAPSTNTIASGALGLGTTANLIPSSADIGYVVVFHTNATNVIDTAIVYTTFNVIQAAPAVPAGLTVGSSAAGNLEISWTANASGDNVTKYVVSVTVGGVETLYDVASPAVVKNFTGLATENYSVKVKAVNNNGESAYTAATDKAVA